jgi:tRNA threonylcarbamoyladenosine biosynthesis protein TsaE
MNTCARLRDGVRCADVATFQRLAESLAADLPHDRVLALHGPLGAGKTTFVQGLARAWDIPGPVTSPTFGICTVHDGARRLVHVDAYRLHNERDAEALLIDELLVSPWCLCVEWAERVPALLGPDALHLRFEIDAPGVHTVRLV